MAAEKKPKLAVWKFASCDGCQLSLLNLEDELLAVPRAVEIAHFTEATRRSVAGPYDVSLVEGSISTQRDLERIQDVRNQSKFLITIGACATAGGIQSLRNSRDIAEFTQAVYARPDFIDSLENSTPIAHHVPVDFALRGCPINKHQLLEVLSAHLAGRRPSIHASSVCLECKARANPCISVTEGMACLGPVTHAGCGAICPAYGRGCYGCYGPMEQANTAALASDLKGRGLSSAAIADAFRSFNAQAPAFKAEAAQHDD